MKIVFRKETLISFFFFGFFSDGALKVLSSTSLTMSALKRKRQADLSSL